MLMLPVSRRPRPDQHRPAAQLDARLARLRRGAARDRRRVPHLHAPAGHVLASRSRPCCSRSSAGSPRARDYDGPAAHDRHRHAPDRAAADPARGRRRSCSPTPIVRLVYQRGEFDAESTKLTAEALFWFSFSLPFSGCEPAAHAHVLLAPAAVAADHAGAAARWSSTRSSRSRSTSRSGSPASCSARSSPTPLLTVARGDLPAPRAAAARDRAARCARAVGHARRRGACSAAVTYVVWWRARRRCSGRSLLAQIISRRRRAGGRRRGLRRRRAVRSGSPRRGRSSICSRGGCGARS